MGRTEDTSAHPAAEIPAALTPGLLTSGGPWILCSTPSARRGVVWNASTQHGAKAGDPMVVWKASSLERNPLRPAGDSAAADAQDAHAAAAEYGEEFRSDLEAVISDEWLPRVVVAGRPELGPVAGRRCVAFVDP